MNSKKYTIPTILCLAMLMALAWLAVPPLAAQASADPQQAPDPALAYLQTQQQPDGGILGFSGVSDPDTSARTALALALHGLPADALTSAEGGTLPAYLAGQAAAYVHDENGLLFPGRAGLLLSAASIANPEATPLGGVDLAAELEASFQPASGAYSTTASQDWSSGAASDLGQAWAILGLSLAGRPVPIQATTYLSGTQSADGSWGAGDPDTTALVVVALLSSRNLGPADSRIQDALNFFKAAQLPNGGWRPAWDTDPLNADTTGWVLQAIRAAGQDPAAWSAAEGDPLSALLGMQKEDGSIGGTYVNAYSTADALIGLGEPLTAFLPQAPGSHAALLVQYSGGERFTACVPFSSDALTGLELLQLAGLPLETVTDPALGTAACGIGGVGCPASDCFCGMPDYWSYWQPSAEGWAYAVAGMDQNLAQDGSLQAWVWGGGDPPQDLGADAFAQVCPYLGSGDTAGGDAASAAPTAYPEPAVVVPVIAEVAYPEPGITAPAATLTPTPEPALPTALPTDAPTTEPEQAVEKSQPVAAYLAFAGLAGILGAALLILRRKEKS